MEGWIRPRYDPFRQYISELSLGPRGWIQIVSFLILGLCMILLACRVAGEFSEGKASRAGPIFLAVVGLNNIIAGVFVTDPVFPPETLHGVIHGLNGPIAFLLTMPISCLIFARRFREEREWAWFASWTVATFVTMVILIAAVLGPPFGLLPLEFGGIGQRICIIVYLGWLSVLSLTLRRQRRTLDTRAVGPQSRHGGRPLGCRRRRMSQISGADDAQSSASARDLCDVDRP